ncbi:MAG: 4Fe-4S dicluster domain-containing protein [Lachnospiraceae bacterium]|nr:4Fe-4S dicluster domain-containing protein [Lachnospiraceae bacterium]
MDIINFQEANCLHCYKCLRFCEVKAIRVDHGQAKIMPDYCVHCGTCLEVCPQDAKTYASDLDKVKTMLGRREEVIVSVAPSYRGILTEAEPGKIVGALRRLGFSQVRETAEGASYVTDEYARLLAEGKMDNIITTSCPAANALIEKYYPSIIPDMAPVASPMIAHGRMLKQMYPNARVVFLGPCLAKMEEAHMDARCQGAIDAVINFAEFEQWLWEDDIKFEECESLPFDNPDPKINQLYPVEGGTIRSVMRRGMNEEYQRISVTGIHSLRELFHSIKMGRIHHCFVEVMICEGGCVNGPLVEKNRGFRFKATLDIEGSAENLAPELPEYPKEASIRKNFAPNVHREKMPSESEIREILKSIGHYKVSTEFNCGACGYFTCRDKAIAIYQGKADPQMCLLNSYEKAKSLSNLVMDNAPNIIFIVNDEMKIIEFNPKAEAYFKITRAEALERYLFELMDTRDFDEVFLTLQPIVRKKTKIKELGITSLETIVPVENQDRLLAIIQDISQEEEQLERLYDKRLETVKMAQEVVDKQMRTAQEIAGLLGETTAETKAILSKVRDMMLDENM